MNDYPTTRQLRAIRNWTGTFRELWEYVISAWCADYGSTEEEGNAECSYLELHTGGWSGNESIVQALEKSKSWFFTYFHTKWERGGHYYFEVQHIMWDMNLSVKKAETP